MSQLPRILVLASALGVIAGCGPSQETQEQRDRKAEEYAKSLGVSVDVSTRADGTRSIAVDTGLPGGAQGGTNFARPAGFPDDVPIYPQLNIVASSQLPSQGFMLQGQTPDAIQQVADFYGAQMTASGWTRESSAEQSPVMRVLPFKKGNRTTSINLIAGSGTTVQLTTMVTP